MFDVDATLYEVPEWHRRMWHDECRAEIISKRIELPFNKARFEHEWRGEGNAQLFDEWFKNGTHIPHELGSEFWLGHLNLIVVDYDFASLTVLVALAGGRGYQAYIRRVFLYAWQNFQARLILTLYVWGLANRNSAMPSWKDVHWGRKK